MHCLVLSQCMRVTDGQREGQTDRVTTAKTLAVRKVKTIVIGLNLAGLLAYSPPNSV